MAIASEYVTGQGVPEIHGTADVWEQSEDVRHMLAYSWDAAAFMRACGFVPDPWQKRFLQSPHSWRMLNCTRQGGKSTTVAGGALHKAIYRPGSLILLLSPGERQSVELMRKCYDILSRAPHAPALVHQGVEQMELANGSRLLALPGKEATVRGFSAVDLLVIDEASRVPDALFFAVQPMLAVSHGDLWTLSTPYGTRGFWYEQYKGILEDRRLRRRPMWDYYEVPATEVPRISPAFLRHELRNMSEWWYMQEYMCKFMDAEAAAFTEAVIERAFAEDVVAWHLN